MKNWDDDGARERMNKAGDGEEAEPTCQHLIDGTLMVSFGLSGLFRAFPIGRRRRGGKMLLKRFAGLNMFPPRTSDETNPGIPRNPGKMGQGTCTAPASSRHK